MRERVGFSPSPTGALHLGSVRTALFNRLFADVTGGAFALRIEDADVVRNEEFSEDAILEGLRWLDIVWDEGPDVGGLFGPYRQSECAAIYTSALGRLHASKAVYPCFCSAEKLAQSTGGRTWLTL